jgi:hypothetical protein
MPARGTRGFSGGYRCPPWSGARDLLNGADQGFECWAINQGQAFARCKRLGIGRNVPDKTILPWTRPLSDHDAIAFANYVDADLACPYTLFADPTVKRASAAPLTMNPEAATTAQAGSGAGGGVVRTTGQPFSLRFGH